MKKLLAFFLGLMLFSACSTQIPSNNEENRMTFEKNDEDEYDIIVLDSQYDYFLNAIAAPKNSHSLEYYRSKNSFYVDEWNRRNRDPLRYDPVFYSTYIDYNSMEDYGLNLEYKLYNFFKFIEWKYGINLIFSR